MVFRPPWKFFASCLLLFSALTLPARASEPQWIRINSSHFTVLTDAGEKKGREIALRFEQMRGTFAQLLVKSKLQMSEPLEIIALKSDEEYARIAPLIQGRPTTAPSFFIPGDDRNYIVLNLFEDNSWRAVSHPFAHLLLNFNYPPTQGWFDEGFAEFFSSLRLDSKFAQLGSDPELNPAWQEDIFGAQTAVRNPPRSLTDLLSNSAWLAMPDLFTARHSTTGFLEGTHHTLFYAQSWIVLHYLVAKQKMSETGAYFNLVQVQKIPVEQAIPQAYGMTVQQFDQAVKDYFHSLAPLFRAEDAARQPGTPNPGGEVYQFPVPVNADEVSMNLLQVPDPEAQNLLAEMMVRLPERRDQGVQLLDKSVSEARTDDAIAHRALAWVHLQRNEYDQAAEELRRGREFDFQDPWVHYYSALLKYRIAQSSGHPFQGLSNAMQDLRVVIDEYPEFAEAYNLLALARIEGGGFNSAIESMKGAVQLNPRSENYLLNMAVVYMSGKKWDQATSLLEQLKSSPDPLIAHAARKDLDDLPTLKKYGLLPEGEAAQPSSAKPATAASAQKNSPPHSQDDSDAGSEDSPARPVEPKPDQRPVKFLKAKLVSVDCTQPPEATLTVLVGVKSMKLRASDYKSLTLVGADEFSCAWRNRPVSINYKAGGKFDGDLVSLEVQ